MKMMEEPRFASLHDVPHQITTSHCRHPRTRPSHVTMLSWVIPIVLLHSSVQGFVPSPRPTCTTHPQRIVVPSPPAARKIGGKNSLTFQTPSAGPTTFITTRSADVASSDSISILSRWDAVKSHGLALPMTVANSLSASVGELQQALPSQSAARRALTKALRRYWWSLPLLLCLVPLYTCAVHKCPPATPEWWKLTNLDHLWHSSHDPVDAAHTSSLLTLFLGSNVSYFVAGLYLLQKYPLLRRQRRDNTGFEHANPARSSQGAMLPLLGSWLGSSSSFVSHVPSRGTWLAAWLLLAGSVSTLFHAVQSFGDYAMAEGWCYLDHGVAIAATLYFGSYCQAPRPPALMLGLVGVAALALPLPGYLGWHSAWHFLSAGAAVLWATQPRALRRAALESAWITARGSTAEHRSA